MRRRDIAHGLMASAVASALPTRDVQAQSCNLPCYPPSTAESSAGVLPANDEREPSPVYDVHRLGAVGDGIHDDSAAIQDAFNMVLEVGGALQFDATRIYKCNSGLVLRSSSANQRVRPAFVNFVDVYFHDDYSAATEYHVWGAADNRVITMDTANSTAGRARVVIRDFAGVPAFASHVRLMLQGRHE